MNPSDEPMPHAEVVRAATEALEREWRQSVRHGRVDVLVDYAGAAAVLLRLQLHDPPVGRPDSVIVKRSATDDGIRAEWAGLAVAGELVGVRHLMPELLATDADANLVVMSDVAGPGTRRIGDLLFDGPRDAAETALLAAQVAVARFNSAGLGKQDDERRIRQRVQAIRPTRHPVNHLPRAVADFPDLVAEQLSKPLPSAVVREIGQVESGLLDPGPLGAITHGDPTVGNLLYASESGVRLLDMETVGYRHVMVDGSFALLRYLYSVWAHEIPIELRRRMLAAYRMELTIGCPRLADDGTFDHAVVTGCAAWLAMLCRQLDRVRDNDVRWGRATYRQRISVGLRHFVGITEEYGILPALGETAYLLDEHLATRWPPDDRTLPTYPALLES